MLRRLVPCTLILTLSGVAPALAQVKLETKFTEGSAAVTRTTVDTKQTMTILGMDLETEVTTDVETRISVGKRQGGLLPVKVEFKSMRTDMSLPGGMSFRFDSANPNAQTDNPLGGVLSEIFRGMADAKLTYELGERNKVESVTGAEEAINSVSGEAAKYLRADLNAERLRKEFQQEIDLVPDKPLAKGDRWRLDREMSIGQGQIFELDTEYEYQGTVKKDGKTLHKIVGTSSSVTLTVADDSPADAKVTESDLKIKAGKETILFDRKLGTAVSRTGKIHVTGTLTLLANDMELAGTLDLTIEQKAEVLDGK